MLSLWFTARSQVVVHVDPGATFYVGENALVYNGGGVQTKGNGIYDIHGNVMIEGDGSSVFRTLDAAGTGNKTDGGNFILRLNDPANYSTSTYGQLYINGLTQSGNITAVVDKEFRTAKHGTYQQIALPFYNKTISSLSGTASQIGTLGKTFTNVRYSKNEVLTWNNATAVSDNLSVSSTTPKGNTYYMLGSNNLDTGNPPASMPANAPTANGAVYTLKGIPFTNGITETLVDAANNVNFGPTGNAINYYNERYNTYVEDDWDYQTNPSNPWSVPTFGRNIYQFGNPYFTNLDLGMIGITESGTTTDNNALSSIQGIRYDPGTVVSLSTGGTFSVGSKFINFTSGNPEPVGDVGLIVKPMQTFYIKLRNNNPEIASERTLNFDGLRRFKYTPRINGTDYSVTARTAEQGSVKQLGVIGLDENGVELARTYYAVYPTAISGHTSQPTVQSILGNQNILGTYEENAETGGYDQNYINSYWLYINEANEVDFFGKAIPLALYNNAIKSLKFEVRENTQLIADGAHQLSSGIGFYYKAPNGEISEITQNQVIPVAGDEYSLFYGKSTGVLGTDGGATKPSRTMVVYSQAVDGFMVRFDPLWQKADVSVYDMSGKLVLSQKNVSADKDFILNLSKNNTAYIVTAISEKGEKISSKIIR